MKSIDLQNVVFSKWKNGDTPTKIFRDLNNMISLSTIKRWCKMLRENGVIQLHVSTDRNRLARNTININKVKRWVKGKWQFSARKIGKKLKISERSARRILKNDLQCKPYKIVTEPLIEDEHNAVCKLDSFKLQERKNNENTLFRRKKFFSGWCIECTKW